MLNAEAYSQNNTREDEDANLLEEPPALMPILDLPENDSTNKISENDPSGQEQDLQDSAEHERHSVAFGEIRTQLKQARDTFQARYVTLQEATRNYLQILQSGTIDSAERANALSRIAEMIETLEDGIDSFEVANNDFQEAIPYALNEGLINEEESMNMHDEASRIRTEIDNGKKAADAARQLVSGQKTYMTKLAGIGQSRPSRQTDSRETNAAYNDVGGNRIDTNTPTNDSAGDKLMPILQ